MPYRAIGWLAVAGLVAGALIGPTAGTASAAISGAIWTSLSDGGTVNANQYDLKTDVYLNGGPQNCGGGSGLPDGNYYFQVTDPSGATLLSSDAIKFREVQVVGGVIDGVSGSGNHLEGNDTDCGTHPVQLFPYDDTPSNGGEYSVDFAAAADVEACADFDSGNSTTLNFVKGCDLESKNDNFKVGEAAPSASPSVAPSASPSPSVTPSESPSVTPSESPSVAPSESPSVAPSNPPGEATIFLTKLLDQDGDPNTFDDLIDGPNWTFTITADGGTPSDASVTTDSNGESQFGVTLDGDAASVGMTEVGQEGFSILWANCAEILNNENDPFGPEFGTLEGSTLSIDIQSSKSYDCIFVNTGGQVQEATGTPRGVTPPPTDTLTSTPASSDSPRLLLLALAGVIAVLLIVTPAPAGRRRR
jgi:hypothetical protein